jgi:hypothetical protein
MKMKFVQTFSRCVFSIYGTVSVFNWYLEDWENVPMESELLGGDGLDLCNWLDKRNIYGRDFRADRGSLIF